MYFIFIQQNCIFDFEINEKFQTIRLTCSKATKDMQIEQQCVKHKFHSYKMYTPKFTVFTLLVFQYNHENHNPG